MKRGITPHLSASANREEFSIPPGSMGDIICRFHLVWSGGRPRIHHPGVWYPGDPEPKGWQLQPFPGWDGLPADTPEPQPDMFGGVIASIIKSHT